MKIIFRYMKKYTGWILLAVTLKLLVLIGKGVITYEYTVFRLSQFAKQ